MGAGGTVGPDLRRQKAELRRHLSAIRDGLPRRDVLSGQIRSRLSQHPVMQRPRTVHSFLSMGSEVELLPLLQQLLGAQIRLAVPVLGADRQLVHSWVTSFEAADWQPAPFGTQAPRQLQQLSAIEIAELDVVLVPLLGFDAALRRIGYGGGYYDRFLPQTAARRVGVAFACQYVDALPFEPHDVSLDAVVTEATLFEASETVPYPR